MRNQSLVKTILVFLLLLSGGAFLAGAQGKDKLIKGKVLDEAGEPVPGAMVINPKTKSATTTDLDGVFQLTASPEEVLSVSFLGFKDQTFLARDLDGKTVILQVDSERLDDAVVIGYGVRKRENLTGAVSSIGGGRELKTATSSSLAQDLAGKVAGLQIRQENGEPGSFSTSLNIRGFGNPLYVVDGVPQVSGNNIFQRLDPNDIESISVIKDALGAVYGRRGANGVVIVTTKTGSSKRPVLSFEAVAGIQMPTNMPAMSNRKQWTELYNEAMLYNGSIAYTPEQLDAEAAAPSTDWYNAVIKPFSTQQQYHLSVEGSTPRAKYYVGAGYLTDEGLLRSGDLGYNKVDFRSNINVNVTDNLHVDFQLSGSSDKKIGPTGGFYDVFFASRTALPTEKIYANDNPDYMAVTAYGHALAKSMSDVSGYSNTDDRVFNGAAAIRYDFPFLEGLYAKVNYSYNFRNIATKSLNKAYNLYVYDETADVPYSPQEKNGPSTIGNSYSTSGLTTLQAMLSYSHLFGGSHQTEATFVYEQTGYHSRNSSLTREYSFYTGDQIDLAGENNMKTSGMENDETSMSYIGRFSYGYKDRYLVDASFRYDGSCLYSPQMRWGFFPVVSAGWRVTEEPWMKNQRVFSYLKLRASYGLVGEDNGKPFQYIPGFSVTGGGGYEFTDGTWTTGAASPVLVNEKLTWFTSKIADVGIDFGFLNNRLTFTVDAYDRDRSGLLSSRLLSLPNTFGASLPQENLNSDRTFGMDFTTSWNGHVGDFYYNVSGNLNYARSQNLYVEEAEFSSTRQRWLSGKAYRYNDVYWGYVVLGQFQTEQEILEAPIQNGARGNGKILPGDYRYKDMNEDGIIDGNDQVPLFYSGYPKLFYGLTLSGSWKGLDFSLVFHGSGFNTIRFKEMYAEVLAYNLNTPAYFYDRWHRADMFDDSSEWIPGKWPSTRLITDAGSNYLESSIWRRDVTYLRLKNLTVGYTLPQRWTSRVGISKARLYVNANNIFTLCDPFVKPFDPEKTVGTSSMGCNYPLMQSWNFGVNISF